MRGGPTFDTDQWTETRATLTSITKLATLIANHIFLHIFGHSRVWRRCGEKKIKGFG